MTDDDHDDVDDFRQQARAWLEANLERRGSGPGGPRPRGVDHKTIEGIAVERAIQRKLFDGGYAGITCPKEYGGQGLTSGPRAGLQRGGPRLRHARPRRGRRDDLRRLRPDHARPRLAGVPRAATSPKILAGEELWVQFFSEPEAGSDLAGIRTRAARDGDRWILNGSKIWSSGAYYADYGMCLARTNWDVPKHRGLTWFAVPTTAPGVTVQPIPEINGDAEFCQEFFDDVELTDDDVIGDVDQGWRVAQTMLVFERGGGSSRPCLRPATAAAWRRTWSPWPARSAGTRIPIVRQLIARAHVNDYAQSQLGGPHRWPVSGPPDGMTPAASPPTGSWPSGTFAPIRARIGMEIGGPEALLWEQGDVDGMTPSLNYLNGRIMSIAGGTNEMQRNGIGERVLGLPREPSFDTNKPFSEVVRDARELERPGRLSD